MIRKISKSKNPIKIREKQLANGNISLYLDIYQNGVRRYEFMKLYLLPEVGANKATIREQNRYTWEIAEAVKAQRYREMLDGNAGVKTQRENKILLVDWLEQYADIQETRGVTTYKRLRVVRARVEELTGGRRLMLKDVDKAFCLGFIDYVTNYVMRRTKKQYSRVTAKGFCVVFSAAMNAAVRDGIISVNPFTKIAAADKIQVPESTRAYLTVEEVKALINTPCRRHEVKCAFLFSCFCGLRVSDVTSLRWCDIKSAGGAYRVEIVMKKTKEALYLPLSVSALKWLPERKDGRRDDDCIFELPTLQAVGKILQRWAQAAGITKHVTFHVARHTFATLNLTSGTDLYTTSKLLGHKNIGTTQIYAKIINQKKDEAVNAVSKLFENDSTEIY